MQWVLSPARQRVAVSATQNRLVLAVGIEPTIVCKNAGCVVDSFVLMRKRYPVSNYVVR